VRVLSREGKTPILICYRDIPRDSYYELKESYERNDQEYINTILRQLTFICLVALKDELKPDVSKYITDCKKAGIDVRMMTSFDKECSKLFAENCSIIENENFNEDGKPPSNYHSASSKAQSDENTNLILDAQEEFKKFVGIKNLQNLITSNQQNSLMSVEWVVSDLSDLTILIKNNSVISRARARDKFILVSVLSKAGYIVAVTGDGMTDFMALKTAHVGISTGQNSSDISKESAEILLMDNNFKSIITAILYGRNIYDSVRKYLQFKLTGSITIVCLVLIASIPRVDFYFHPNQLLWINLIIFSFGTLSLVSEQPDRASVLSKAPYKVKAKIVTPSMRVKIAVMCCIQIMVIIFLIFFGPIVFKCPNDRGYFYFKWSKEQGIHTTVTFNVLVMQQVFNALISRSLDIS
ncbi:MAG: cation-translocating P-type ATPase, partial [bacterium]|nr:cation-translocating P-type ATPase [bacterium]